MGSMTKNEKIVLAGAGVLGLILLATKGNAAAGTYPGSGLSYLGQSNLPRGMRNNNPGNIRVGSSPWIGKVPLSDNTDGAFEQFYFYRDGVRAMIKLLKNYIGAGRNTIRKILYSYAPPSDGNNTDNYISVVSGSTGIFADDYINPSDKELMFKLSKAMAFHENGQEAITRDIFNEAWAMLSGIGKIYDTTGIKPMGRIDRYHHKSKESDLPIQIVKKYALHSIEFGNWVSQKERLSLSYQLDKALSDFSKALGVPMYKIGFGQMLSIALGARGSGTAMAHFEPHLFVINMTKTQGAGSLAHEWAHAFDRYIGNGSYASGGRSIRTVTKEAVFNGDSGTALEQYFERFFDALYWEENGEPTAFLNSIKKYPDYWIRRTEVWARTFEVFTKIILSGKGISSPYLVEGFGYGHEVYPSKALVVKARPWIQKIIKAGFKN